LSDCAYLPEELNVYCDYCRFNLYTMQGNSPCDDPAAWPFARVAMTAAGFAPDLVIHVGDYHYRETPCADRAGCANSPHGDTWRAWQADFFDPAEGLLASAPWIMLRGNHEDCLRAGAGWQLLRLLFTMPSQFSPATHWA